MTWELAGKIAHDAFWAALWAAGAAGAWFVLVIAVEAIRRKGKPWSGS